MATAKASVVTASSSPDTRRAGRPSSSATTPPATAHSTQGEERVDAPVGEGVGHDHAADADEGDLAEADDAAPAGQDHERQRGEAEGERRGWPVLTWDGEPTIGTTTSAATTIEAERGPWRPRTSGSLASAAGRRRAAARERPRALAGLGPGWCPCGWTSRPDDDDQQQHHVGGGPPLDVPRARPGRATPTSDAGDERRGHRPHAGDDGGGQGRQQDRRGRRRRRS